eukprot:512100-Amphidinium_carterae.1
MLRIQFAHALKLCQELALQGLYHHIPAVRPQTDPLASKLLNYQLVLTDLTKGSYARPSSHRRSGWHNIRATHEAHRASGADAQLYTALLQDFFCVAVLHDLRPPPPPPRTKHKCVTARYHGDLQNSAAFLGFDCKAAILYELIRSPLEN